MREKTKTRNFCEHAVLMAAALALAVLMWFSAVAHAGGGDMEQQKAVVVNVESDSSPWPAIIGATGALGAAAVGVFYRRGKR